MAPQQPQSSIDATFKAAFDYELENGLDIYGQNALAIFALSLYLMIEDVDEFAANAITEDSNDKKADIFYLDLNEKRAVIAQNYFAVNWGKFSAIEQKASDLNTAITWLLTASEDDIPIPLKPKATDLRRALKDGDIKQIDILYIHNCYESPNVGDAMKAVESTARLAVDAIVAPTEYPVSITSIELGLRKIDELYKGRQTEILVDTWLELQVSGYVEEWSSGWKAILTTVPGDWIFDLYTQHETRLFSANYRDYLGSVQRKGNINRQITETASSEPQNFWVYNNGITALTDELQLDPSDPTVIRIRGISIINGAQTTGALSHATSVENIRVPIRIVECSKKELIHKIIQYNNTQNIIKPADMRSNDHIQKRLRDEFDKYGITYVHRRSDARISRHDITATAVAAALCAFHGDLQTAHRNAPEIFVSDSLYNKVFPENISAEHVFLVRCLSISVDKLKDDLKGKVSSGEATKQEVLQYDALKYAASKPFIIYLVGELAEEITGKPISNRFTWVCKSQIISPFNHSLSDAWNDALRAILPQVAYVVNQYGKDPFYEVPRSADLSKKVANQLKAVVASIGTVLETQFYEVKRRTEV
jgi:hypothetical protein